MNVFLDTRLPTLGVRLADSPKFPVKAGKDSRYILSPLLASLGLGMRAAEHAVESLGEHK